MPRNSSRFRAAWAASTRKWISPSTATPAWRAFGSNNAMDDLMNALIRPRTIAVIGASPKRQTLGNVALDNLANYKFAGKVIPVHGEAPEIAGLAAVPAIEALPEGVDVALASVPAAGVADVVRRLDRRGVRTAIVNTAGFSAEQEAELRLLVSSSRILMHGPNCMGLINLSDATPIYTGGITSRIRRGPVALIAQSGSAAISVINSSTAGFSKIVTIGSEFRVTGADYLRWLASDDDTSVVGLVLESIPDADRFADAVDLVHAAGKSMVVLKVGRSATGARATLAHTGALIRNDDAFKGFVERYGIPVVDDYEELIATLEAFAVSKKRPTRGHVGLMGISGGETALACDICDEIDLPFAVFSEATSAALRAALPGIAGQNPLDIGQSVGRPPGAALAGMTAIMNAEEVGIGVVLQDMQASLPASSHHNYTVHLATVAELSRNVDKPIVLISPTAEIMSDRLLAQLEDTGVPPLRGLWPGLVAVKSMAAWSGRRCDPRRLADRKLTVERAGLQREIAGIRGPLPSKLVGPARELRDSGRQIRRGAFGGGGAHARRPDRLPDGRESNVRRRAAPFRRWRGPAWHQERGGPQRSVGADRKERPGESPGRRDRWLRDAGRTDRLRAGDGGLPGGAALWCADDRRHGRCPGRTRSRQGAEPEPGDRRRSRRPVGGNPPRQDAGRLSQSDSPHRYGSACRAGVEPVGACRGLRRSCARMRSQSCPDPQGVGRSSCRRCLVRRGRRRSVNCQEKEAQRVKSPLLTNGRAAEVSSFPDHERSLQREDHR